MRLVGPVSGLVLQAVLAAITAALAFAAGLLLIVGVAVLLNLAWMTWMRVFGTH